MSNPKNAQENKYQREEINKIQYKYMTENTKLKAFSLKIPIKGIHFRKKFREKI